MKRSLLYFSILLVLAITLTACTPAARATTESYVEEFAVANTEAPVPAFDMAGSDGVAPEAQFSNVSQGYQPAAERMVIQNANLSLVVKDPAESMDAIIAMTEGMGGFVVSSYLYKTTTYDGIEIPAANLTVRVPVAQLTTAMSQIKAMVEKIDDEDIKTEKILLGFRCSNGVELSLFDDKEKQKIDELIQYDKIYIENDKVFNKNFLLADELALYILD